MNWQNERVRRNPAFGFGRAFRGYFMAAGVVGVIGLALRPIVGEAGWLALLIGAGIACFAFAFGLERRARSNWERDPE